MTEIVLPILPLLTAEEEIGLARHMEAGTLAAAVLGGDAAPVPATQAELQCLVAIGRQAREHYVLANLRLVTMVAHPAARRSGLSSGDLFQEGVSGLLQAVDRFDYRQGVRFATYALPWIRAHIARAVANRCGQLPLSAHRAERRRRLQNAAEGLSQQLGRQPTHTEIAQEVGLTLANVTELLAYKPPVALVGENGAVIDPPDPCASAALDQVGEPEPQVGVWLRRLPVAERRVLRLRYGFVGTPHSYAQVAARLGLAKSTVRRMEARALERLRGVCSTEHLSMAG